jgi:hypothetical protein
VNKTIAEHWPLSTLTMTSAGQVTAGVSASSTVTVNEQLSVLPAASDAVQSTVVVPTEKVEPLAGAQTTLTPGQLSVAVAVKVTTALHWAGSVFTSTFAGQTMPGFSASVTVTVNEHAAVLPLASVAVQFTVVCPRGNGTPLGGTHATVASGQLSEIVGVKETVAVHWPASVSAATSAGQAMAGCSVSLTVTVNEQSALFPAASVAVQVTVVLPRVNSVPLAGLHATLTPGQLSLAPALNTTAAVHFPGSAATSMLAGQVMVGT